jgi:hypothetical protein
MKTALTKRVRAPGQQRLRSFGFVALVVRTRKLDTLEGANPKEDGGSAVD